MIDHKYGNNEEDDVNFNTNSDLKRNKINPFEVERKLFTNRKQMILSNRQLLV